MPRVSRVSSVRPSNSRTSRTSGTGRTSRVSSTNRTSQKPKAPIVFDCVSCGACCYNPNDNRELNYIDYIEIETDDRIMRKPDLVRRLVVLDDDLIPHMRLSHHQRCVALTGRLGVKVGCSIYHDRPDICKRFEAGSKKCKQLRKERGVD